jgi:hypothetical protein
MSDDDRDLRDLFARLKSDERARIAPFRAPIRRATPQPLWVPRIAVAAAIVVITLVLVRPDHPRQDVAFEPLDLRAATWRSPTDFLLVTPGSELLRTVPAVGAPDESMAIDRYRSLIPESTRTQRTPS